MRFDALFCICFIKIINIFLLFFVFLSFSFFLAVGSGTPRHTFSYLASSYAIQTAILCQKPRVQTVVLCQKPYSTNVCAQPTAIQHKPDNQWAVHSELRPKSKGFLRRTELRHQNHQHVGHRRRRLEAGDVIVQKTALSDGGRVVSDHRDGSWRRRGTFDTVQTSP